MKKDWYLLITLILYYLVILYFAVISRVEVEQNVIRLDLFQCYNHPAEDIINDIYTNIAVFLPIGLLVGLMSKKNRVLKAIIVGLHFSLVIEFSQLIWHRGVFDVDDIFNNSLGALIGGIIVTIMVGIVLRYKNKR